MFPKISETFIVSQITGLIDRGHEVTIIAKECAECEMQSDVVDYQLVERTLYPKALAKSKLLRLGAFALDWLHFAIRRPKHTLAVFKLARPFNSQGLRRFYFAQLFLDRQFDLIHCHFGFVGQLVAELAEHGIVSAPIITSYHGTDIGDWTNEEDFRLLHERGTAFTTNSKFSAKRAIQLGCPEDRLDLLPVGLDLDRFAVSERRYHPAQTLRLVTVGRLVSCKGIDIIIDAVAQLTLRGIDLHLDIIGDGPERVHLEQRTRRDGIARKVTFHGAKLREELIELLREAHLFVLASTGAEGQGLVLQEAQAMGLPVIASRCGGIPEGVVDGETGLLFPEGDSRALADCIVKLRESHNRWPRLGRSGRELVERRFNIESLNDRLVEIYEHTALLS